VADHPETIPAIPAAIERFREGDRAGSSIV
jgi:hypothetical protein